MWDNNVEEYENNKITNCVGYVGVSGSYGKLEGRMSTYGGDGEMILVGVRDMIDG